MNDINFKGGFWIKSPSPDVWQKIKAEFPSSKSVFEEFNEQGDKFFAIKNSYDKAMTSFLLRMKINFKLYPNLNLKSGLSSWKLKESKEIIDAQTNVIETKEKLEEFVRACDKSLPVVIPKYRWKPNDHIEKTYKAIGINPAEYEPQIKDGITYIKEKGKDGKIIAIASPNNSRGINYVYVYPQNWNEESSQKFALGPDGDRIDFSPLDIINFHKNFMRSVRIDLKRIRPQKQYPNSVKESTT